MLEEKYCTNVRRKILHQCQKKNIAPMLEEKYCTNVRRKILYQCQFFVLSYYVSLRSDLRVVMSAYKRCSVRLYLQLFVEWLISYLCCLCLFAHSGIQHILCCVFVLFVFVMYLVCPMLPGSLDCPFLIAPRYSLTFIYIR